jgi:glycine oxidase
MLAPLAEVDFVERGLLDLKRESLRRYPAFVAELEAASGLGVDYRPEGTLVVALDRDDAEHLRHQYEYQRSLGLPVAWLGGAQALEREPFLSPRVQAAVHIQSDHQVDTRRLLGALEVAAKQAGARVARGRKALGVVTEAGRVVGVELEGGEAVPARAVVVAAGCWSRQLAGLPAGCVPPVRPVKGQMLAVQMPAAPVVRGVIRAPEAYLVPRSDGRLVVGATSEEQGFDEAMTAGGLFELLRGAYEALPILYELPVTETWVGFRPGSLDNAPILGWTWVEGLAMATGHHRNGILLTPVTADEVARSVWEGVNSPWIEGFGVGRFGR